MWIYIAHNVKLTSNAVTWPKLKCISIHRTCIVDLGWVNMHTYSFFLSGPKTTKLFCSALEWGSLIMPFSFCQYLYGFRRYSRSKLKVVLNCTKFWTFALPNFKGVVLSPSKVVPGLSPPPSGTSCDSFVGLLSLSPKLQVRIQFLCLLSSPA